MRRLAALGLGVTMGMPLVFFATGFERGPLYLALQVLAAAFSAVATWGVLRGSMAAVAVGFGGNALNRLLHVVLGLSRLPPTLNWGLVALWALAAAFAVALAMRPTEGRASGLRGATWLLAVGYFLAAFVALSGGRLPGVVGLMLGCVGLSLAAPNLHSGGSSSFE